MVILFFTVPILAMVWMGWLFFKKKRHGLLPALICFILVLLAGTWSILQSRSSTAGIGFLFLPFYATIAGIMGYWFEILRSKKTTLTKIFSIICLILALGFNIFLIQSGFSEKNKNKERDIVQKKNQNELNNYRKEIEKNIILNKGQEVDWLNKQIKANAQNRNFLLAALEQPYVDENHLTIYASSNDMGLKLMVARNKNTPSHLLTQIYNDKEYPPYYYQALADHKNTPKEILTRLYDQQDSRSQSSQWLAKNPSTPRGTLLQISKSNEIYVLYSLLENQNIDCEIVKNIETQLQNQNLSDQYKYRTHLVEKTKSSKDTLCLQ